MRSSETRAVLRIPGHGGRGQSQGPGPALCCSEPREGQGRVRQIHVMIQAQLPSKLERQETHFP